MIELGQLEKNYQEFTKRNLRVVVVSNDDQPTARQTQGDFPHLVVVADTDQKLATSLGFIHTGMGPGGTDTNAPSTLLVDGTGTVRWFFRPDRFLVRLSAEDLLAALD